MNKIKKIIFGINTQISTNNNYFIKFLTNALKNECDFDEKSHLDIDINFDNNFFNSKKTYLNQLIGIITDQKFILMIMKYFGIVKI